jgi:hypothetical protein
MHIHTVFNHQLSVNVSIITNYHHPKNVGLQQGFVGNSWFKPSKFTRLRTNKAVQADISASTTSTPPRLQYCPTGR